MTARVFNFSAGPATLPEAVIKQAQQDLWSLGDSGIGIMEHSHRSAHFTAVIEGAEAKLRALAGIPDNYDVLFLQGGASTQFFMLPMNLLGGGTADYIDTGSWSVKAIKEAKKFGDVHVAGSGKESNYSAFPASLSWSSSPKYIHYTSNNTIAGTQFASTPDAPEGVWLACDASSDILSRPIEVAKHGIIYAGAQKNLGPSGVTVVVIRKDLVESGDKNLPTMLQYRTHAEKASCYNTPPTFAIYIVGLVLNWIEQMGGLDVLAKHNESKAAKLYDFLDNSSLFECIAKDHRSLMNVTFRTSSPELDGECAKKATAAGLVNLKGHRSVGGLRASIYNAMPTEGIDALVSFLKEFESKN